MYSKLVFFCLLATLNQVNAHEGPHKVGESDITTSAKIQIKTQLLAGWLVSAKGDMYIKNDSLFFIPTQAKDLNGINGLLYAKNHLFAPLCISLNDIYKISRRNALLINPNGFVVKLKDGRKYKFFSYRRAKIRNAFYAYKNQG